MNVGVGGVQWWVGGGGHLSTTRRCGSTYVGGRYLIGWGEGAGASVMEGEEGEGR